MIHNPTDNYLLSIEDRAGNESQISVTIVHVHNFVDNVCTICGQKEYEEIELTENNLHMTGITTPPQTQNCDYDTPSGDVVIPDKFEYNGNKYLVKSVNFSGKVINGEQTNYKNITSLTLPNTIKTIKEMKTFENIDTLNIPISVERFNGFNLYYFKKLTTLYYNAKQAIASRNDNETNWTELINSAILESKLELYEPLKVIIGNEVETMPYLFRYSYNSAGGDGNFRIKEIDLRNSKIKTIPEDACRGALDLESVLLPDTIETIEDYAFYHCNNLTITVPNNIKSVGWYSFGSVKQVYYNGSLNTGNWGGTIN